MKAYRLLRADEVEVRISTCNQYGVQLLLYKDARVDMNLLDEVHGSLGWQNYYELIDGQLFANVEIWDEEKKEWIQKQNVGVESYTEKEKGRASDAFKRACFNLGIGRELYTAPNMFVLKKDLKTLKEDQNGRWTCKDYFTVQSLEYEGERIAYVTIKNEKTGGILEFGEPVTVKAQRLEKEVEKVGVAKAQALLSRCNSEGVSLAKILALYKLEDVRDFTEAQYANLIENWNKAKELCKEDAE